MALIRYSYTKNNIRTRITDRVDELYFSSQTNLDVRELIDEFISKQGRKNKLQIVEAKYGVKGRKKVDVTKVLRGAIQGNQLSTIANNELAEKAGAGDPSIGIPKTLYIRYKVNGERHATEIPENHQVQLP